MCLLCAAIKTALSLDTNEGCRCSVPCVQCYATGLNSSLPTPQSGHSKSAGKSSKAVPGAMPCSGSPTSGSYTQPHTSHTYFSILVAPFFITCLYYFKQCKYIIFLFNSKTLLHFLHILTTAPSFKKVLFYQKYSYFITSVPWAVRVIFIPAVYNS